MPDDRLQDFVVSLRDLGSTRVAVLVEELLETRRQLDATSRLVKDIPLYTKHGPDGRGDAGPCHPNCLKCRAERWDREVRR
jgi:hypothetical protein